MMFFFTFLIFSIILFLNDFVFDVKATVIPDRLLIPKLFKRSVSKSDFFANISGTAYMEDLNIDRSPSSGRKTLPGIYDGIVPIGHRNDPEAYDVFVPMKAESTARFAGKQKESTNSIPKKPLSGFFYFTNEIRSKVREEHPEYSVGQMSKELSRRWIEADDEIKKKYEAIAEADVSRFEKEMLERQKKVVKESIGESPSKVTP